MMDAKPLKSATTTRTSVQDGLPDVKPEDVRFDEIRIDEDGLVTEPTILAGLPIDQVMSPLKRQRWVELRKKGLVPAET